MQLILISTKQPTTTVYTTSGASTPDSYDDSPAPTYGPAPYTKRSPLEIAARQDGGCTVTETFTTTFGSTYEFYAIPSLTSTFTQYEAFTQATVTSTSSGGTAYAIATATATTEAKCGPTVNGTAVNATTSTVTQDARCAPSALTSEYNGYGLDYSGDTPAGARPSRPTPQTRRPAASSAPKPTAAPLPPGISAPASASWSSPLRLTPGS